MTSLALALVAGALIAGLIGVLVSVSRKLGAIEERSAEATKTRDQTKQMASEMLKEKSVEEVIRDLGDGKF